MTDKLLNKTESLCPVCLKRINAKVILRNDRVLISKRCLDHGKFECFHAWNDPFLYKEFFRISKKKMRFIKDTTLDVTSRCNMGCPFCFSTTKNKFYEPDIQSLAEKAKLWGEGSILLYGGEPTLRKDLFEIIKTIKSLGLGVHILTNGLKLDKKFVKKLDDSGLDRVQLQFDSLDDSINVKIRKRKLLENKLRAIRSLNDTKIDLTLFVVLFKNYNENQIDKIISFAAKNCDKIATVIFTPVSPEGRYNNFEIENMYNDEIFQKIEEKFDIKKEDFVVCTKFDIILSNFLYKMWNIKRRSTAPCEALCYIFVKDSKLTPLNKLIELEKLSEIFDNIAKSGNGSKLKMILSLFAQCVRKKIKINPSSIPFLLNVSFSLFFSSITKKQIRRNFKKSFGLIVNPSQDRYNADYNFIKKCNLYSDIKDDGFITFCENNIFSTGPKKLKSLNFDMIVSHEK